MFRFAAIFVLLLGASSALADDVLVVEGSDSLDKIVKENDFVVLELYAPWCGHCKKLEPEYAKAAELLKDHDPKITLAKCDATDKSNEKLKTKFQVKGFPTLKIIKNGNIDSPLEYQGPREAEGIVSYLKKQVQPAVRELESKEAVDSFLAAADVAVLAYVDAASQEHIKTFSAVAEQLRNDVDFGYVTDAALANGCDGSCKSPFVVMHKKGEADKAKYEGDFKQGLLHSWVESRMTPLVIKFGQSQMKHVQKVFQSSLTKVITVAEEASEELWKELVQAAEANDELKFLFATPKEGKRVMDYYGIKDTDMPAIFIDDAPNAAKYLQRGIKPSNVPEVLKEFHDGVLEKFMKSEEAPADNSGPVKVVTGKTFQDIVLSGKADVLIEFYAPWCGHCKKLAPVYEEVGKHFENSPDVVIAKMDATVNDTPSTKFPVKGFPTLFFAKKSGEVIPYNGGRTKADLVKFVEEARTVADDDEEDTEPVADAPLEEAKEEKKDEL